MKTAIGRLAAVALCAFALALTAAPAAANRAWALTEALILDRPGHGGRMVGQLQTCDEVRLRDSWRNWVLVQSRRGDGWVERGLLSYYQPGMCRYEYRPPHPIRPPYPIRPPRPIRPLPPEQPIWPHEPEIRPPYWGP